MAAHSRRPNLANDGKTTAREQPQQAEPRRPTARHTPFFRGWLVLHDIGPPLRALRQASGTLSCFMFCAILFAGMIMAG